MSINEAEILLIEMISLPQGSRVDFLNFKRKEINYSKQGFYSIIKTALENWYNLVNKANLEHNEEFIGIVPCSLKIPLLSYTKMRFDGHLGYEELELIHFEIEEWSIRHNLTITQ